MKTHRVLLVLTVLGFAGLWGSASLRAQEDDAGPAATEEVRPAEPPELEPVTEAATDVEESPRVVEWKPIHELIRPVGGGALVRSDEEASEVVVVFGRAEVEGRVRRDMVVVLGQARVDGEVGGDLVAPFTDLELGPNAHIRGDLVVVGGALEEDPDARVDGDRVVMTWEQMERDVPGFAVVGAVLSGLKDWLMRGLLLGRLLPHTWGWWWWVALAMGLLYFLIAVIAPRAVTAGTVEIETQPVASFFVGILGYILVNILFLVLTATGLGVLAIPFLFLAVLLVQAVGKGSVYQMVGARVARQWGSAQGIQPLPALVIGMVLFTFVYMIPVLGLLAWLAVAPLGFGAALMAMFRTVSPSSPAFSTASVGALSPAGPSPVEPEETEGSADGPQPGPPPVIGEAGAAFTVAEMVSLPRAGFWIRTGATFLDLLVVGVPTVMLRLEGGTFLVLWIAYHVAMWAWRGTTVGGVVARLKVVRLDGQPINFAVALVRSLAAFLSAVALFLGFFWVGWTREKCAWHDLIGGTVIVRVPPGVALL